MRFFVLVVVTVLALGIACASASKPVDPAARSSREAALYDAASAEWDCRPHNITVACIANDADGLCMKSNVTACCNAATFEWMKLSDGTSTWGATTATYATPPEGVDCNP